MICFCRVISGTTYVPHARTAKQHQVPAVGKTLKVLGRLQPGAKYLWQHAGCGASEIDEQPQKVDARGTAKWRAPRLRVNGETVSYTLERVERTAGLGQFGWDLAKQYDKASQRRMERATLNPMQVFLTNTRLALVWDATNCRHPKPCRGCRERAEDYRLGTRAARLQFGAVLRGERAGEPPERADPWRIVKAWSAWVVDHEVIMAEPQPLKALWRCLGRKG